MKDSFRKNVPTPSSKKPGKYSAPPYVLDHVKQSLYLDWLRKKAAAHVKRDRKRWNETISASLYQDAIHRAVKGGDGKDPYTGALLEWGLIGKYRNELARGKGSAYKKKFRLLPTVDHLDSKLTKNPKFQICSWEVNDAKSDLSHKEFVGLCQKIVTRLGSSESA